MLLDRLEAARKVKARGYQPIQVADRELTPEEQRRLQELIAKVSRQTFAHTEAK